MNSCFMSRLTRAFTCVLARSCTSICMYLHMYMYIRTHTTRIPFVFSRIVRSIILRSMLFLRFNVILSSTAQLRKKLFKDGWQRRDIGRGTNYDGNQNILFGESLILELMEHCQRQIVRNSIWILGRLVVRSYHHRVVLLLFN